MTDKGKKGLPGGGNPEESQKISDKNATGVQYFQEVVKPNIIPVTKTKRVYHVVLECTDEKGELAKNKKAHITFLRYKGGKIESIEYPLADKEGNITPILTDEYGRLRLNIVIPTKTVSGRIIIEGVPKPFEISDLQVESERAETGGKIEKVLKPDGGKQPQVAKQKPDSDEKDGKNSAEKLGKNPIETLTGPEIEVLADGKHIFRTELKILTGSGQKSPPLKETECQLFVDDELIDAKYLKKSLKTDSDGELLIKTEIPAGCRTIKIKAGKNSAYFEVSKIPHIDSPQLQEKKGKELENEKNQSSRLHLDEKRSYREQIDDERQIISISAQLKDREGNPLPGRNVIFYDPEIGIGTPFASLKTESNGYVEVHGEIGTTIKMLKLKNQSCPHPLNSELTVEIDSLRENKTDAGAAYRKAQADAQAEENRLRTDAEAEETRLRAEELANRHAYWGSLQEDSRTGRSEVEAFRSQIAPNRQQIFIKAPLKSAPPGNRQNSVIMAHRECEIRVNNRPFDRLHTDQDGYLIIDENFPIEGADGITEVEIIFTGNNASLTIPVSHIKKRETSASLSFVREQEIAKSQIEKAAKQTQTQLETKLKIIESFTSLINLYQTLLNQLNPELENLKNFCQEINNTINNFNSINCSEYHLLASRFGIPTDNQMIEKSLLTKALNERKTELENEYSAKEKVVDSLKKTPKKIVKVHSEKDLEDSVLVFSKAIESYPDAGKKLEWIMLAQKSVDPARISANKEFAEKNIQCRQLFEEFVKTLFIKESPFIQLKNYEALQKRAEERIQLANLQIPPTKNTTHEEHLFRRSAAYVQTSLLQEQNYPTGKTTLAEEIKKQKSKINNLKYTDAELKNAINTWINRIGEADGIEFLRELSEDIPKYCDPEDIKKFTNRITQIIYPKK